LAFLLRNKKAQVIMPPRIAVTPKSTSRTKYNLLLEEPADVATIVDVKLEGEPVLGGTGGEILVTMFAGGASGLEVATLRNMVVVVEVCKAGVAVEVEEVSGRSSESIVVNVGVAVEEAMKVDVGE
jgi:hypothetical protein